MSKAFLRPGARDWFRKMLVELEEEGTPISEIKIRKPINHVFKNVAAIHPEHRKVFENILKFWKMDYLLENSINNIVNYGEYSQKLEGIGAVADTIEGFLNDPRCVWEE